MSSRLALLAAILLASGAAGAQSLTPEVELRQTSGARGFAIGVTRSAAPTQGWTLALRSAAQYRFVDLHVGVRNAPDASFSRYQLQGPIITADLSAQLPMYSAGTEALHIQTAFGAIIATDTHDWETSAGLGLLASASVSSGAHAEVFADAGYGFAFLRATRQTHQSLYQKGSLFSRLRLGVRIYP